LHSHVANGLRCVGSKQLRDVRALGDVDGERELICRRLAAYDAPWVADNFGRIVSLSLATLNRMRCFLVFDITIAGSLEQFVTGIITASSQLRRAVTNVSQRDYTDSLVNSSSSKDLQRLWLVCKTRSRLPFTVNRSGKLTRWDAIAQTETCRRWWHYERADAVRRRPFAVVGAVAKVFHLEEDLSFSLQVLDPTAARASSAVVMKPPSIRDVAVRVPKFVWFRRLDLARNSSRAGPNGNRLVMEKSTR
jgi:hypothetical protein